MKIQKLLYPDLHIPGFLMLGITSMIFISACNKTNNSGIPPTTGPNIHVYYLASDDWNVGAVRYDTTLQDGWGLAISPVGTIWVASSLKGLSTIYDGNGNSVRNPVVINSTIKGTRGHPTGVVVNQTTDFFMPPTGIPAQLIFAGLDGSITAWNQGDTARLVASKNGASYTGMTMAFDGHANYLFVADFADGTVDVLDKHFTYVSGRPFTDPSMPSGYAPYNVANINGLLFVTYAMTGNGNYGNTPAGGYVDVYNPDGTFVKRFASGGTLEEPWGMVIAPDGMGLGSDMLLIGNFLDGIIGVYDSTGTFKGTLNSNGYPLLIPGLWGMATAQPSATNLNQDAVYFSGGPDFHTHGVYGYFKKL